MPSVREIMMARAKAPAPMVPMERVPTGVSPSGSAGGGGLADTGCAEAGTPVGSRPPRPPQPASGGGTPSRPSEGRKPRSGGPARDDPGQTGAVMRGRRAPSEPPRQRPSPGSDPGSGSEPKAKAKAKARASSVTRARIGSTPPPVERNDVGKVPAYLKKRNEEVAEQKREAARPKTPQPPPGYRKVDEPEKNATLAVLRSRKQEVVKAQQALPFNIETMGQKQREKDLATRMEHVDKLIDMFSKPTVFIPLDAESIAKTIPPLAPASSPSCGRADEDGAKAAGTNQRSRVGPGMADVMMPPGRPSSGNSGAPRLPSRESRAAASAERRQRDGEAAPWDREESAPRRREQQEIKTGVQVVAPPGGKSSMNLGWD